MSIDEDVLKAAKQRAAEENRTLGDLITEALRARFAPRSLPEAEPFAVVTGGEGGALPGVDITANAGVRDRMDET